MRRRLGAPLVVERRTLAGGGPAMLELSGDLVVTTGDLLREAVRETIESGKLHVFLDFRQISHVDTPGLALLYRLHELCGAAGGSLTVVALPSRFTELTHQLRLEGEIRFRDSVESAVEDLPR